MSPLHHDRLPETVLVADLSSEFVDQIAHVLRAAQMRCIEATSRHESLRACARHRPQLAIIGFSLIRLGLTGEQLCEAGAHHAVAVLPGPNALQSLHALRAGFDSCLYAPVEAEDLACLRARGSAYRMLRERALAEFP